MKSKLLITVMSILFSAGASAHKQAPDVIAVSKAVELGVHRIERLVTLKKIDEAFRLHLIGLGAELSQENGATYKVHGYMAPGADGKSTTITLWMDNQGKTLAYNVTAASAPSNPFSWPTKDSVTLMEEGLHFVLEGWAQHPEVKSFYTGLQTISLTPVRDGQGNIQAQFKVTSDDTPQTLFINLKTDGTFLSYEVR